MGKTSAWLPIENVAACRAFCIASEHSKNGFTKDKELFSEQVRQIFKNEVISLSGEKAFRTERTGAAIIQRFRSVTFACRRFEEIMTTIKTNNLTKPRNEEELEFAATVIFTGEVRFPELNRYMKNKKLHEVRVFPFRAALSYLRTTRMWSDPHVMSEYVDFWITSVRGEKLMIDESGTATVKVEDPSSSSGTINIDRGKSSALEQPAINECVKDIPLKGVLKRNDVTTENVAIIEKLAEASRRRTKILQDMLANEEHLARIELFSLPGTDPTLLRKFLDLSRKSALQKFECETNGSAQNLS